MTQRDDNENYGEHAIHETEADPALVDEAEGQSDAQRTVDVLSEALAEGHEALAPFGDGNPATRITGVEEAEALARYHLATSAAGLQVASEKASENPGSIQGESLRKLAKGVALRLNRSADLMDVFNR